MVPRSTAALHIAGLAVEIEGPATWVEALRRIWSGWMDATAVGAWSLSVAVGPPVSGARPLFETRPRFEGDLCTLTAPGFAGWIDPALGTAHLEAHPRVSGSDLAIFVRTCFALQAFARGAILFHAAGVVHRGRGYAFFGLSGSGKTTAASSFPGDIVLNDDLILVRQGTSGWEMAATPFGENHRSGQDAAPLHALLRLIQAPEDRLAPLGPGSALGELVANSPVVNAHAASLPGLLARWQGVLQQVPLRALHFRKGPAFWEVLDAEFGESVAAGTRRSQSPERW